MSSVLQIPSVTDEDHFRRPPSHLDLPCSDGKPVDNTLQIGQSILLSDCLLPLLDRLHPAEDYYVGADVGIYWHHELPEIDSVVAPDWYYVPNVTRLRDGIPRRSYVLFREIIAPLIVVEVVSGTGREEHDRTPGSGKFWIYENAVRSPYLLIYSFRADGLEAYELVRNRYRRMPANPAGRVLIPEMEVEFGTWQGRYAGYSTWWLRPWHRDRALVPTAQERAAEQQQRADDQKQQADLEKKRADEQQQRAEKLAQKLREMGVDPDAF